MNVTSAAADSHLHLTPPPPRRRGGELLSVSHTNAGSPIHRTGFTAVY